MLQSGLSRVNVERGSAQIRASNLTSPQLETSCWELWAEKWLYFCRSSATNIALVYRKIVRQLDVKRVVMVSFLHTYLY